MRLDHMDQLIRQEREIRFELESEEEVRERLKGKQLPYIIEARLTSTRKIMVLRDILRRLQSEIAEEETMRKVETLHAEKRDSVLRGIREIFGTDKQSKKSHERGDARTDRTRASADENVQPDQTGGGEHPRGDA